MNGQYEADFVTEEILKALLDLGVCPSLRRRSPVRIALLLQYESVFGTSDGWRSIRSPLVVSGHKFLVVCCPDVSAHHGYSYLFGEDFGRGIFGRGMGKSISRIIPLPNIPLTLSCRVPVENRFTDRGGDRK
jgi:hypothetical protein